MFIYRLSGFTLNFTKRWPSLRTSRINKKTNNRQAFSSEPAAQSDFSLKLIKVILPLDNDIE
jgi:hypothetical protein